ncbi:MAG: carboxypeptidase regulatory-like domain-containing protein [Deltaproteobacteria bacterium]|nr:carboxypeptidase regulatory-like domain-containing protein [Deltaproteobacteria bacterium]
MVARVFALVSIFALVGCSEYEITDNSNVIGPEDPADPVVEGAGGIEGRICGPDGTSWLVGADVTVLHDSGVVTGVTDVDGWFTLEGIPVGTWDVLIQKGSFSLTLTVPVEADQITVLPEEECLEQGEVQIAVVTGTFDHIEGVLDTLGFSYDIIDGDYQVTGFLRDPSQLEQYDIIFFNCGMDLSWSTWQVEIGANLRDYVANGGSVYASDWAYYIVESGWPHMNTFYGSDSVVGDAYVGESGYVTATVLDATMVARLGSSTAELNYDLPSWAVMEANHEGSVLLEGTVEIWDPWYGYTSMRAPLAAQLDDGDGSVIYTSFHNEAQTTLDMRTLLQEIILSL